MKVAIKNKLSGKIGEIYNLHFSQMNNLDITKFGYSSVDYEFLFSDNITDFLKESLPSRETKFDYPLGIHPVKIPPETSHILILADIKGLGDVKSRLAAIQSLKKQNRNVEKTGYLGPRNIVSILKEHENVDYILTPKDKHPHDAFKIEMGDIAGRWESARGERCFESREEIYTRYLGLNWNSEQPILYLNHDEKKFSYEFVGKCDKPKLGVFLRSAEIWKDWRYVLDFIELAKKDYEVFNFDISREIKEIRNVVGLDIREVMSILCYMDCVLCPDTAGHHLCEALDIPCIALFGSMRIDRYLNRGYGCSVDYIQGKCIHRNSPCLYRICEGKGNYQPCMDWFKPEYVLQKVKTKIQTGTINDVRIFK